MKNFLKMLAMILLVTPVAVVMVACGGDKTDYAAKIADLEQQLVQHEQEKESLFDILERLEKKIDELELKCNTTINCTHSPCNPTVNCTHQPCEPTINVNCAHEPCTKEHLADHTCPPCPQEHVTAHTCATCESGHFDAIYNGNTRIVDGMRYVGHHDGVIINWNDDAFILEIYIDGVFDSELSAERGPVYIKPNTVDFVTGELMTDTREFQIVFRCKTSLQIMMSEEWRFYHNLPKLVVSNMDDGSVKVSLDRNGYLFQSMVSYTYVKEYGGKATTVMIGTEATEFILDVMGIYVITVTNQVSASLTYVTEVLMS